MSNLFKKTGYLTRTYLKKDSLLIVGAILSLFILITGVAAVLPAVFKSYSSRVAIVETIKQPAMKAIIGPFHGNYSVGSIYSSMMIVWSSILAIIFSIIIAIKNTRSQEDSNLSELLLSKSIGRLSLPMASFFELSILFTITFLFNFISLTFLNISGLSIESSFVFSLGISLIGLFFGTLTILFAQLANTSSGTNILSYATFLVFYVLLINGSQNKKDFLLWSTPFGWLTKLSVTDKNYLSPLFITILFTIIILVISFSLQLKRDIGTGILPTLKGRKSASALLSGFSSLIFRNQLTSMLVWIFILFCAGLAYGSAFKDIGKIASSNPLLMQMIAKQQNKMIINFSFMILGIFSVISTIPGLLTIFRIKTDETKGFLELIHSKKTSRTKIFSTYFFIGILNTLLTFFSGTLGLFYAQNSTLKNPISFDHFFNAFISYLPIMLFILTIGAFLITFLSKFNNLIWLILYYAFFVNYFGKLFKMPKWSIDISLFGLIKRTWITPLDNKYIIAFLIGSLLLWISSLMKYNKRDLVF
ncbi:ABC transporter permease [Companilactobacillus sp. DQM5]|uniref:ABC transporter permease n=1 Tax=Companilactobacillus sp. DQM5 TaxID=3463359 RepID=UPI0040599936